MANVTQAFRMTASTKSHPAPASCLQVEKLLPFRPTQAFEASLPQATWHLAPPGVALQNGSIAGPRTACMGAPSSETHTLGWAPPPPTFLTHVTLVLPAVLPLLVGVAHAAIAVHVDVTWG